MDDNVSLHFVQTETSQPLLEDHFLTLTPKTDKEGDRPVELRNHFII